MTVIVIVFRSGAPSPMTNKVRKNSLTLFWQRSVLTTPSEIGVRILADAENFLPGLIHGRDIDKTDLLTALQEVMHVMEDRPLTPEAWRFAFRLYDQKLKGATWQTEAVDG